MVGAGGREHALAWRLARDPAVERVLAAPGNAGIARVASCFGVAADDASVCGIQITAHTPTPAIPIAVRTAPGTSRCQLTRRPSSR